MPQYQNIQQPEEEDQKPKINYTKLNAYLRATAFRDFVDLDYIVHENTLTILTGHVESDDRIQQLFKNNYTALLSLLGLENILVELDTGVTVVPLTVALLKELSGISL